MNKLKWIILFLICFACMGYFREFFFVHLNNIMYYKYYNRIPELPIPKLMFFFDSFSFKSLYYFKYIFTFFWASLFLICNYFTLKKLTNTAFLIKLLFIAYALILLIASVAMLYGYLINNRLQSDEYTLSRWLLGIAQSPLICLILLASEKLYNKSIKND